MRVDYLARQAVSQGADLLGAVRWLESKLGIVQSALLGSGVERSLPPGVLDVQVLLIMRIGNGNDQAVCYYYYYYY